MRGTWVLVLVAACGFRPTALATGDDSGTTGDDDGSNVIGMDAQDDAPSTPPMPTGLIAWYTMDTLGVMQAHDETGHGHDATCTICPTLVAGKIGNGFHFDGTERFDVADAGNAFDTAGFTVATWVNFETMTFEGNSFACPTGKVEDATIYNTWELCFDSGGGGSWLYDTTQVDAMGFATFDEVHDTPPPTTGTWYHTAMTWDGHVKTLWLNGKNVATKPNVSVVFEPGGAVTFGADTDNGGQQSSPFVGIMDDLRIYDHALAADEIAALAAH
jgi:Concanavalin A-like lectin/glucanases superfamily